MRALSGLVLFCGLDGGLCVQCGCVFSLGNMCLCVLFVLSYGEGWITFVGFWRMEFFRVCVV